MGEIDPERTPSVMPDTSQFESDFVKQITAIIEKNITNELFGVSELADETNMSRSNLLRRVKKETKLSVSQLINQVRLKRSMELLRTSSFNVSEVSLQVGFSSTSYFIKCFREYYGYPPGEVGKRLNEPELNPEAIPEGPVSKKLTFVILGAVGVAAALAVGFLMYNFPWSSSGLVSLEKSIAVLPFKNDSNDSSNVYLINGLMESTLNNLQQIKDLKVISRTSTEKYRNTSKSIPEMAKELNVNYFVEGSGQKIGDRILLNIQLIDGRNDKHLWAKQYKREAKDIFELQQEIAKNIAEEIQAIITPEEEKRIEKIPTDNLVAYDLFLKGRDIASRGGNENLKNGIEWFNKAIAEDNGFALAYADATLVFYYLDMFQEEKKYMTEISSYADKALLLDPTLAESLVAKSVFYIHKKEYELAVPYLEKALKYNPNSSLVVNFLSDFYFMYIPNTTKYLEYALKGVRLDVAAHDSVTTSNNYLRLSHALLQSGFIDEALTYVNKSLEFNPRNPHSGYLKVWVLFFKDRDFKKAKDGIIKELKKDTTRMDILQEAGKICFLMGDYESSYQYYEKFIAVRNAYHLDFYKQENLNIGIVFAKMGYQEKSKQLIKEYKDFADNDQTIYKNLYLTAYYSYSGDAKKAIDHLKLFSKEDNFVYWILLWDMSSEKDPISSLPEFKKIMKDIEAKFWKKHNEIKVTLEEEGLL